MTFSQKIDKILSTNPYGVSSINALEIFCKISTSSIQRSYNVNREPTIKLIKRLQKAMHIPIAWWDNPIGDPFIDPLKIYKELCDRMEKLELKNNELIRENRSLARQNSALARRVTLIEKKSIETT